MAVSQHAGKVIVLNGTSSAGKTSLALELQRVAPELQPIHVQLDAFRAMEPAGYWSIEYKEQGLLRLEALCRAINSAVAQFARFGQNVILDHVLTPEACRFLLEDLAGHDVLLVKVECSHEQLRLREAGRGDRESGLAESQLESVHTACSYDFEVNTTSSPPTELARRVAVWLRANSSPAAINRMHSAHAAKDA
ncbi:chloramphenicol phosphotransferase CPT family protein [Roseateles toxinivorans]|uniref:Chloramphenicol 3-O phosphotransferase n=1 Tax=Roseateles toxinivorans TaxID=270368 RepID=A0A4R6QGB9_9BURK|nr:AAA family ATPase [Roseateles toxinivorans]TDP61461.1 chloramphenicol 3-O phosphotransferase [Roseateles toxinivorans]